MINIDKSFRWVSKEYFSTTFARLFLIITFGIIIAEYFDINANVFLGLIIAGLSIMIFSTLCVSRLGEWIFVFAWSIFLFGSGGWLLKHTKLPELDDIEKSNYSYVVKLETVPIVKGEYYQAESKIIYSNDSIGKKIIGHNVLLNFKLDSLNFKPQLCDRYLINAKIYRPHNGGLGDFDYGKYLVRNGICGVCYVKGPNVKYLSTDKPSGLRQNIYLLREKLIKQYQLVGLENSQLAIISAITLGEKGLLPNEVKDMFSVAGVSHILVVSGMHVGFIFLVIMLFIRRFRYSRRWIVVVFGLIILWLYALLTGLAPSVVRATFMFSMIMLFNVMGEMYRMQHVLCFSATILLLCNPNVLFNIGFQLSYLAVIGIVYFYPLMYSRIKKIKFRFIKWILQAIAVTISAQIFTLPIVIHNFNQFPSYFILSNLFVTAFAPILFIGGIVLLILSYVPYVGLVVGWIMNYIVIIFEYIIDFIVSIPFSSIKVYISLIESILLYLVILCGINWIELRNVFAERFKAPLYFVLSVFLFSFVICINNIYSSSKEALIIPNTNNLMVNVFNHSDNILFTNKVDYSLEYMQRTWLKYSCKSPNIVTDSTLYSNVFIFNDESYLILRDNVFRYLQNNNQPFKIDCLIIDKGIYPSERLFNEFILPKRVILTAGVWGGYIEKYKDILNNIDIPYHIISESGAIFIIK